MFFFVCDCLCSFPTAFRKSTDLIIAQHFLYIQNLWDHELQSLLQMGFDPNPAISNLGPKGSSHRSHKLDFDNHCNIFSLLLVISLSKFCFLFHQVDRNWSYRVSDDIKLFRFLTDYSIPSIS